MTVVAHKLANSKLMLQIMSVRHMGNMLSYLLEYVTTFIKICYHVYWNMLPYLLEYVIYIYIYIGILNHIYWNMLYIYIGICYMY